LSGETSGTRCPYRRALEGVTLVPGVSELIDMARWEGELKTENQTVTPIA